MSEHLSEAEESTESRRGNDKVVKRYCKARILLLITHKADKGKKIQFYKTIKMVDKLNVTDSIMLKGGIVNKTRETG